MKKNKREIYKQMKEENAKKLNLNKVKPSFSEFLRQKKLKDSTNTNNKQLTKSYTSTGNNFLKNNNIEEKIIDEQYKENFEEEYESEKEKNINDSQEENIINENENVRYKNLSDKGEEKEEYIDGENDDLATKKTNEVSRSYIIDEWTKDFNLNGDMVLLSSSNPPSCERVFYGLKNNGRNYFPNNSFVKLIDVGNDEGVYNRYESNNRIVKIVDSSTNTEKEYILSISTFRTVLELYDIETFNFKIKNSIK